MSQKPPPLPLATSPPSRAEAARHAARRGFDIAAVGALAGSLATQPALCLWTAQISGPDVRWHVYVEIAAFGTVLSWPVWLFGIVLLGVPAGRLGRRLGWRRLWQDALLGAVLALLPLTLMLQPDGQHGPARLLAEVLLLALPGAIAGATVHLMRNRTAGAPPPVL